MNGKEQILSDGKFTLDVKFDTTPIVIAATDKAGNVTTVTVNAGHNYGTDWKSDSNGHWHECAVCGEKSEVLAHTEDSGTVTKNTSISWGESSIIMRKDPATVNTLVPSCKRSVERVALTVSTS